MPCPPHHLNFYKPDALPDAQPTVSKHWRHTQFIHSVLLVAKASMQDSSPTSYTVGTECMFFGFRLGLKESKSCGLRCNLTAIATVLAFYLLAVLWHYWLGVRKNTWPVKIRVMRCWHGYLSGAMQMICIWSSWRHCQPIIFCFIKIQIVQPIWCRLIQVIL